MSVTRSGDFKANAAKVENGAKRGLILAGMLVAQRGSQKAPRKTGRLKRNISHGEPYVIGDRRYAIDVGTNVEYAKAQEFGTGPYEIYPKTKRALAFDWLGAPAGMTPSKSGKFIFAHVSHPGVKAQPYLRPALRESKGDIERLILKSVLGALRKKQ